MRKAKFEPGLAEKILLYMDSDTGWKVGGGGKGKFLTHNKRFWKNALLIRKKVGAMTHRCPFVGGPAIWGTSLKDVLSHFFSVGNSIHPASAVTENINVGTFKVCR